RVAQDVGRAMRQVERVEQVRSSLQGEAMATGLSGIATRYGLTLDQLEALIETETIPLDQARDEMDRTLAAVAPDPLTEPLLDDFRERLAVVRAIADEGAAASAGPPGARP